MPSGRVSGKQIGKRWAHGQEWESHKGGVQVGNTCDKAPISSPLLDMLSFVFSLDLWHKLRIKGQRRLSLVFVLWRLQLKNCLISHQPWCLWCVPTCMYGHICVPPAGGIWNFWGDQDHVGTIDHEEGTWLRWCQETTLSEATRSDGYV